MKAKRVTIYGVDDDYGREPTLHSAEVTDRGKTYLADAYLDRAFGYAKVIRHEDAHLTVNDAVDFVIRQQQREIERAQERIEQAKNIIAKVTKLKR